MSMPSNAMNFEFQQQMQQKMNMQKAQFIQQQQLMQIKKQQMDNNPVLSQFMAQQQQRAQSQQQFNRAQPPFNQQNSFPGNAGQTANNKPDDNSSNANSSFSNSYFGSMDHFPPL
jgi:hypothetical protein